MTDERYSGQERAIRRFAGRVYRSGQVQPQITWDGYVTEWARLHGGYDPRRSSPLARGWLRMAYILGRFCARLGLRPNAVTVFGFALSVGVAVLAAQRGGWPILAAALVLLSAIADTVDGALAVITGRTSRLGQVYDAFADRLSEACWLVALALLGAAPWLVAASGGLTWLHEYLRAKSTGLGVAPGTATQETVGPGLIGSGVAGPDSVLGDLAGPAPAAEGVVRGDAVEIGVVTVGERPTRVLVVIFALLFAGLGGMVGPELPVGAVTAATAIWGLLQAAAMLQLFVAIHHDLS